MNELQSYLIHRIEVFLNGHNRKLLGWDEILEGGLAPNATVMSWRGTEGGMKAVESGHKAIMTPGEFCYFDSYQDAPDSQPEAIGGYLPLSKVYSFNPVPDTLSAEKVGLVYGVQANLFTEYIPTPEHAEMMIYPRVLALAEVAWSAPSKKNYEDFHVRALKAVEELKKSGYNPFELKNEIGNRPGADKPVEHLAVGKKVTYGLDAVLLSRICWRGEIRPWSMVSVADGPMVISVGKVSLTRKEWILRLIWKKKRNFILSVQTLCRSADRRYLCLPK